ncbi:helix-turn-helix domain-containing protein [Fusobacterium perfoetens]|uniref:helix-turn-helix domain-containing protein n=1 Tax=Fusobacterium perfoetens TaxID=852 RepID=UPI0015A070E6|nr:helix-turn-helix domain-containing protein [Fusobacterium perfoetens]MCF2625988.1 helix-turn-helix domain-containing protein [Fusobacterium perfoetens]
MNTEKKDLSINSSQCVRERFRFLFDNLDIDEFRLVCAQREKQELDEKIKIIKKEIRRENKQRRIWKMAENIEDEINEYLIKASKPRSEFEKMLLDKMKKELGTVTSVKELSRFLKMNQNSIYKAIDNGEILSFKRGKRKFIVTEGILPFLRD